VNFDLENPVHFPSRSDLFDFQGVNISITPIFSPCHQQHSPDYEIRPLFYLDSHLSKKTEFANVLKQSYSPFLAFYQVIPRISATKAQAAPTKDQGGGGTSSTKPAEPAEPAKPAEPAEPGAHHSGGSGNLTQSATPTPTATTISPAELRQQAVSPPTPSPSYPTATSAYREMDKDIQQIQQIIHSKKALMKILGAGIS